MAAPKRICLGVITGAHGVQGAVRIKSFTQVAEDIGAYGRLSDAAGGRQFELRVERATAKGLIAKIGGINDRTAAEALKGTELYVERGQLPALNEDVGEDDDEDEFYFTDLIGLPVERSDGSKLGTVKWMNNFGAGDVMEIELDAGGLVVIPFTKSAGPLVDLAAGRIVADPPPGLMPNSASDGAEDKEDEQVSK